MKLSTLIMFLDFKFFYKVKSKNISEKNFLTHVDFPKIFRCISIIVIKFAYLVVVVG